MSGKFKFSLDKLLDIRKEKEEESKRLFTESMREKRKVEEKLEGLQCNYDKYKGINPNEDVIYQKLKRNYIQGLQRGIKTAKDDLLTKNLEVDKRRRELIEKQVERKTVETLKDKIKSYLQGLSLKEIIEFEYFKTSYSGFFPLLVTVSEIG